VPLLDVKHVQTLTATIQIDRPIAETLDKYTAFLNDTDPNTLGRATADQALCKALEYVFSRDRDFQKWLDSDAASAVKPSLRVKQPSTPKKTSKAAKKPRPIAVGQ
jgi:hypothetical protein